MRIYRYTYRHEGGRLALGEGARPSDWIRLAGDLGEYARILARRGAGGVWTWIVMVPGYGPAYPVVEARLMEVE
jgi:hypothetical protein